MKLADLKVFNLPDTPGVYFFRGKKGKILYVGKATNLKDRVKSYFARGILMTRSPLIVKMLLEAERVTFTKTDSVLEALLLEASEIKKHQPIYNSKEKDDKSYNYVTITQEGFPKVVVTRGSGTYGPFPHGAELKEALKIVRKVFPFRDRCLPGKGRPCFNAQIGLCPGVCTGRISKTEYRRVIKHLILFFEGKKRTLVHALERDMKKLAKEHKFEDAEKVKRKIFALKHIQDIALIKKDLITYNQRQTTFRIEAYDVAHISGTNVVSVMTVVEDGELAKSQYRKFKICADNLPASRHGNDDTGNLKETLTRRFAHPEWRFPNLIVVDGGRGQINAAKEVLKYIGLDIIVVSVVKDERHKAREIIGDQKHSREVLLANSEAHS